MRRTGLVLSWLVTLFLLVDGGARLAGFAPYVEGLTKFGYDPALAPWIALSLLVSTILYAAPRTAVLGAILVTGYLGGAVATQVRVGDPWFLFPAFLGALAWAGLWCRSPRIRELLPLVR
jgi:DoxX-like family